MSTLRQQLRTLYRAYQQHCKTKGIRPLDFQTFKSGVQLEVARMMSRDFAGLVPDEDTEHTFYIASRVSTFAGVAPVQSTVRKCAQCQFDVFIDVTMLNTAERSKAIICTICVPEVTGKTPHQILQDMRNKL